MEDSAQMLLHRNDHRLAGGETDDVEALTGTVEAAALQVIVGLGLILQAVGVDSFDARLLGTQYLRSGVGWLRRACCNLLETN